MPHMPNSQAYNDIEVEDHSATNHGHDDENQHHDVLEDPKEKEIEPSSKQDLAG